MPEVVKKISKRVLEPHERISEVLFGLIMVLTFTGSLSVAEAGQSQIRTMLIGALGCNFAWGVIDGVLYVMGCLAERGQNLKTLKALRGAKDPEQGQQLIAGALPPLVASVLKPEELETMRQRLLQLPEPPVCTRTSGRDWLGAFGVFLLVFLSTFPVAVPFMVMQNTAYAMRASNSLAVVMLFISGIAYGRCVGRSPLGFGVTMVVLGMALVALTMALGG
jgi:hypothetical protein